MATRRLNVVLDLDTGNYTGRLAQAGAQMRSFGGSVDASNKNVVQMSKAFENLSRSVSAPAARLRDHVLLLGNIRFALINLRDMTVGWIGSLVMQSSEVERLTILMKGMSDATTEFGKNVEAHKNLESLYNMSRNSGFAMKELTNAFVKMKSAGINPLDGKLQALTDSVAFFGGSTDVMQRASVAIQQMAGKGVVSMEELRQQLGEAVPTAMSDMAVAMGLSMPDLADVIKKGKTQAIPALEGMFREFELKYAGAGERMAESLNGQLSAFKTNVTQLSTYFTGMNQVSSPEAKSRMAVQQDRLNKGEISQKEFDQSTRPQSGLFASSTSGMKQLNEAMMSNDAKAAMIELGQIVDDIAVSLLNVAKVAIEWRDEIGTAVQFVVTAFAVMKATQLATWFAQLSAAAVSSLANVHRATTPIGDSLAKVAAGAQSQIGVYDRLNSISAARVTRLQGEAAAAQGAVSATKSQMQAANALVATERQSLAFSRENLQFAKARHDNVLRDRAGVLSKVEALRVEQAALRSSETLAQAGLLTSKNKELAEQRLNGVRVRSEVVAKQLALATSSLADHDARLVVAENGLATAQGRSATAANALRAARAGQQTAVTSLAAACNAATAAENRSAAAATASARASRVAATADREAAVAANANRAAVTSQTAAVAGRTRATTADTVATRAHAAANGVDTASTVALTAATSATTVALGIKTLALRAATVAATALGTAVNIALGPIGMIATALYFAAKQAGVFETSADRAAAAAKRLAQSIGDLRDVQTAKNRLDEIDKEIKKNEKNDFVGINAPIGEYGGAGNYQAAAEQARQKETRAKALKAERKRLEDNLRVNAPTVYANSGTAAANKRLEERNIERRNLSGQYATSQQDIRGNNKLSESQKTKQLSDLHKTYSSKFSAVDQRYAQNGLDTRQNIINNTRGSAEGLAQANAYNETMRQGLGLAEDFAGGLNGVSDAAAGAGAAAAGAGAATAGSNKSMSEAETAAKKAATAYQNARDKYSDMVANQAGNIAQLEEELEGGTGALAKFQAQVAKGKFADATKLELSVLELGFKRIDKITSDIAHKRSMKKLTDDLVELRKESELTWKALNSGNWEKDTRAAQVRAKYQDEIDGETDPVKKAEKQGRVDEIVTEDTRVEAAGTVKNWDEEAERIRISLMTEDQQREINFQNEVERQRQLIDMSMLNYEQRKTAEASLANYMSAMNERRKRENESAVVKMAREWSNVGGAMKTALAGSIDSFVNSLGEGKFAFGDFAKGLLKSLLQIIAKALIAYAILSAIGQTNGMSFGSFMSSSMGGPGVKGGSTPGGNETIDVMGPGMSNINPVMDNTLSAMPKFHTGGWFGSNPLRPGEVPLVGLNDEVALTREQQRFYGKAFDAAASGGAGGQPNVQINVINNSDTKVNSEQSQPEFNGRDMIVNVVLEAAQKQGPMRDMLEGFSKK